LARWRSRTAKSSTFIGGGREVSNFEVIPARIVDIERATWILIA
jgi:hypothetical protein